MVVDLILDRQCGCSYMPEQFYRDCMCYGDVAEEITRAMDFGDERDVKRELCNYITDNEYNPDICKYINSVDWL